MRASSLRRSTRLTASAIAPGLGGSGRNSSVKIARTWATVTAGVFPPQPQPLTLQEPQGYERQRHLVMPADPTTHLVMVQTDRAIALSEQFLDAVPAPMHLRHVAAPRRVGVAERVPGLRLGFATAEHRQALAGADAAVGVLGLHVGQQDPHLQRSFLRVAHADLPPAALRLPGQPALD